MRGRLDFCVCHSVLRIASLSRAIGVSNAETGKSRSKSAHGRFDGRLEVFGRMPSKVPMVGRDAAQRANHLWDVDRV